jgi:hypothetical protein
MIQSVSYYNSTPELREAQMQDFYKVIKGLGYTNTGSTVNNTTYGVEPLVIDGVTIHVNKEPKYFLLSTERYSRSKRDGGKSVKIPIGTLINAPRIKRTVKEMIQIQKDRAAAELARQNSKKVASEYAAELNEHMKAYGASATASYSEAIIVRVPAKALSVDYLQRQGYSLHVNDTDMEFTVDHKTNKVLYIECEKSMPRLQSYGSNARKELETVIQRAKEELNRLQVAEGLMDHYVQSLKIAEMLEAETK